MRVARRLKREQAIQQRKALREQLKDAAVVTYVREKAKEAWQHGYTEGYAAGRKEGEKEELCQSQTEPSC